jgi:hypothetical protein
MPGGNKRKTVITAVLSAVFLLTAAGIVWWAVTRPKDDGRGTAAAVGVWWWEDELCARPEYLDFAKSNGVNEIYLCTNNFNGTTADFIRSARGKGIAVYLLTGEYQYIYGSYGRGGFDALMVRYLAYQSTAAAAERFSGVHLDVEPHQDPNFDTDRTAIMERYLNFVVSVCAEYKDTKFDFDIPFWFDDIVEYGGQRIPLYAAVISASHRVFVMSYRDTAAEMWNVGKEEVAFAKENGRRIFLCASADSAEGDRMGYSEEGRDFMTAEMGKLKDMADYDGLGIAIHHIKIWYDMPR